MKRKLAAVLKSYIVCPWLLAGALVYSVVAGIAMIASLSSIAPTKLESIFDRRHEFTATLNQPSELLGWEANQTRPVLYQGISLGRRVSQDPSVGNGTRSVEMNEESLACLSRMRFLRKLELNAVKITPELWQAIACLPDLRSLTIRVPGKISLNDLPILPNLELLSLSSVEPGELALLKEQPRLRSIEIADSDFIGLTENNHSTTKASIVTASSLHELVQLREIIVNPRMQALNQIADDSEAVRKSQSLVPIAISPALCGEIRLLPNLRRIAIGERGAISVSQNHDDGVALAIAGRARTVQVNGRTLRDGAWLAFVDIMLSILLVTLVNAHLSQQFSSPMALLLPDFMRPHLLLLLLVLFGHVVLFTALRIQVYGSCLIPSIVESSLVLVLSCVLVFSSSSSSRLASFIWTIGINSMIPLWMPHMIANHEHPIRRFFLLGEYPFWTTVILITELGLFLIVLKQRYDRPKALAISNRIDQPAGVDLGNDREKSSNKKKIPSKNKQLHLAIAKSRNSLKNWSTQLWNAGINRRYLGQTGWLTAVPMILIYLFLSGGIALRNLGDVYRLTAYILPALLFVGIYGLLLKSFFYVDRVFARQPFFGYETVLPLTRSMMRTIQLRGLWIEIGPRLLVSLCVACLGTVISAFWPAWLQVSIASIWLSYFHCLSAVVGIWGLGLLLLPIRLEADRRLIAYPLVLVWASGTIGIVYQRTQGVSLGIPGLEWVAAILPGVVGIFMTSLAWVRLPQMETGRMN